MKDNELIDKLVSLLAKYEIDYDIARLIAYELIEYLQMQ